MAIAALAGLASVAGGMLAAGGVIAIELAAGYFALGAGLSLVSRALAPKPSFGAEMQGITQTQRGTKIARRLVYGQVRVGGALVFFDSSGTDNEFLHLVVALAGHEIDHVEKIYFNDDLAITIADNGTKTYSSPYTTDYTFCSVHLGDQTTADSSLVSASTKWTNNHILYGTAYVYIRLTYNADVYADGVPNISAIIRGKKVNTTGSNVGFSQNPAYCLRDYITDTTYGLGEASDKVVFTQRDNTSSSTSHAICDQSVTTKSGTQTRYTIDGVLSSGDSIKSNLESMLSSMGGQLIYTGGKYHIKAGAYSAPEVTLDESNIVGGIQTATRTSRRGLYNAVRGSIPSADDNYQVVDYPPQINTTSATSDAETIFLEVNFPMTTEETRAQRLAKQVLARGRQQIKVSFNANMKAFQVKVGDTVTVKNEKLNFGTNGKVFEIIGYRHILSQEGALLYAIDAVEISSSVYDWTASNDEIDRITSASITPYNPYSTPAPTNLNSSVDTFVNPDGTASSILKLSWTAAADSFIDHYAVDHKENSENNDKYRRQLTNLTEAEIGGLEIGKTYNIRVHSVNQFGVTSASALTASIALTADTLAPAAPTSVSATAGLRSVELAWTSPTATDLEAIEIHQSTDNSNFTQVALHSTSNTNTDDSTRPDTFIRQGLVIGTTYYFKLKARDRSGNKSDFTSVVSATPAQVVDDDITESNIVIAKKAVADSVGSFNFDRNQYLTQSNFDLGGSTFTNVFGNLPYQNGTVSGSSVTLPELLSTSFNTGDFLSGATIGGVPAREILIEFLFQPVGSFLSTSRSFGVISVIETDIGGTPDFESTTGNDYKVANYREYVGSDQGSNRGIFQSNSFRANKTIHIKCWGAVNGFNTSSGVLRGVGQVVVRAEYLAV